MYYLRRFIELSNSGLAVGTDKSAEGAAHTTYANCLQEVGSQLFEALLQWLVEEEQRRSERNSAFPPAMCKWASGTHIHTHTHTQVGDMATAISSLEAYLETMSKGMDQTGPAIACCSLGILFYNKV
eukprot:1154586-Pelagomonas_calceolata.AAC.4